MRAPLLKLPGWHKRWLYTCFAALAGSGLAWLLLHYGRDADTLPLPAEAWALRIHGLASMAGLMGLGMVAGSHVPAGWRISAQAGRLGQRRSGLWLSAVLMAVVLTAYGLLYLVPEAWHEATGWVHAGLAACLALLWAWHRPRRRRAGS